MHRSVLQNEDFAKFTYENAVDVMSLSRLDEGIEKKDEKSHTYDTVDADGKPVKYLVEWPNLTIEEMYAFRRTKAGQYNNTSKSF